MTVDLKPWYFRWASLAYRNGAMAAYWYCQHRDGTVYVYRELIADKITSREAGAKLAQATLAELQNQNSVIAWAPANLFDYDAATKSAAMEFHDGIASVIGRKSAFLWQYTEVERMMPEDRRWHSLEKRKRAVQGAHITVQAVTSEPEGAMEYARSLMNWRPLHQSEALEFDRATAIRLRDEDYAAYLEYMRHVEGPAEISPRLSIHESCTQLITALGQATVTDKDIALPVESFLCGMAAHRGQQNRQPMEAFIADRLNKIERPGRVLDEMQIAMCVTKAQDDYKRGSSIKPMTIPRIVRSKQRVRKLQ